MADRDRSLPLPLFRESCEVRQSLFESTRNGEKLRVMHESLPAPSSHAEDLPIRSDDGPPRSNPSAWCASHCASDIPTPGFRKMNCCRAAEDIEASGSLRLRSAHQEGPVRVAAFL